MDTNQNHANMTSPNETRTRKRCHGNKKLNRFRRRRRNRNKSEEAINKEIEARKREKEKQNAKKQRQQSVTTMTTTTTTNEVSKRQQQQSNVDKKASVAPSTKRKRDVLSQDVDRRLTTTAMTTTMSTASQPSATKKLKKTVGFVQSSPLNNISVNKNYPLPPYLIHSPHLIFQSLAKELNCSLNKRNEQAFIHLRLQLLDRQYRLNVDQQLWQSYLQLGSEGNIWPHQLYQLAKTDQPTICQQFVMTQLSNIQQQLDQCSMELIQQARSLSSVSNLLPSIDVLDEHLKEYVSLQENYLLKRIENELVIHKNDVLDQKLYHQLSAYHLTSDQQQAIQQLIHLQQLQFDTYKELIMLKERILHQFLPANFDQLEQCITEQDLYWPVIDDCTLVDMKTKRRKILQEAKRTILNIYMYAYRFKINEYEQQYQQALNQLELDFTCHTTTINDLTLFQAIKNYLIHRTHRVKQEINHKKAQFQQIIARHRQRSVLAKKSVGVSPQITINVRRHLFNEKELDYLSLGENYIRPNQSALRPYKHRESQIQNNLKDITKKVQEQLTRYCKRAPPKAMLDRYTQLLEERLRLRYMAPLSFVDHMRAQREYDLVKSIRRKLRKGQLILRVCDKGGGLHLSSKSDYERKAAEYRQETNAYEELSYNPLEELLTNVTNTLKQLKDEKLIPLHLYNRLVPNRNKIKQAYMYFNPKPHKEGTPLRPIMNTIDAVTRAISDYLDELIRPVYNENNRQHTVIDSTDLIKRLETYAADGRLKPSTWFCIFDINNLFTMLPQDKSIEVLEMFLHTYRGEYVQRVSVKGILKLAEIVLKYNAFVCNNKFYKQVIGGAMGSPFTLTLANIFMWHWEQRWIRRQDHYEEIYVRYIDDVFITSNEPIEIIQLLLNDANTWDSNIKLKAQIAKSVPFLDVLVSNEQGVLHTSVYHKPSAEPYVVPFRSDHPRHTFPNIVQTALVRAIRYSSTFETFTKEHIAIELMLLYNGYPSDYIDKQFRKVLGDYISKTSILAIIGNESQFHQLRRKLLDQPSPRQSQIEASITRANQDDSSNQIMSSSSSSSSTIHQKLKKKLQDSVIIHYTHETRFTSMKRDMHEIFREAFQGFGLEAVRLIVGHRNNASSQQELIRKRPHIKNMKLNDQTETVHRHR